MNALFELIGAFFTHPEAYRVLVWWLALAGLGIAFLPLTLRLFRGFHDGGYLFARVLGLLLTCWAVWLAASIGLAPFSAATISVAVALAAALNYAPASARSGVREFLRHKARIVVAEEYLFLAAFLAWAFLRSVKPEVDSIEKFMDLGFVNAVLRAEWMPPADMWLSGKPINYYYFGHVFTAFLCRLARVPSEIGFNLMIATLFALAVSLPYSIVSSLLRRVDPKGVKKAVAGGLLAASLLAAGGTLHPFIYGALLPTLKNAGLYEGEVKSYWYWDATRFIGYRPPSDDKTIHEVPLFTFVLGELHGHALDIPAALTATGIGSALLLSPGPALGASPLRIPYAEAVGGVLLGAMWMTNTWDYPIYLLILLGAAAVLALRRHGARMRALAETALAGATLVLVSQAAALPYTLRFEHFTEGIRRVSSTSPLWQLAVLWGYQAFFALCFALFLVLGARRILRERGAEGRLNALLDRTPPPDIVALGMFAAAAGLVLIPEVVYVKDLFSGQFPRANTMFKITYQAFILFALASGYAALRIVGALNSRPVLRTAAAILFATVAAMPMTYAYWAVPGYYGPLPHPARYRRLDGLAFLSPGDREIVRWLGENTEGQTPILEADGAAYSKYGRISMATGLPTPLGWYGHQWLWRGSAEEPNRRVRDVRIIYESDDRDAANRLMEEYGVRYIVIGALEREKFPNIKEAKLEGLGRVVVAHQDGSKLVEIGARR